MAERLAEVGKNLALWKVHVDEIKEQDINAQVMPPEMLERLTDTVKREGRLEQLPFCVMRRSGEAPNVRTHFELISGHHRLRAARSAGMTELFILADERDLSRSKVVAKQLAHNRIGGESDKQILARLYDEMKAVDDVLESYVKPQDFDDIRQLEPSNIANMSILIDWRQLSLVFLPKNIAKLEKIDEWAKKVPRESQEVGVVPAEMFERFRDAVLAIGRAENVRALGTVMGKILDICDEYITTNKIPTRAELVEADAKAAEAKADKAMGRGGTSKRSEPKKKEWAKAGSATAETVGTVHDKPADNGPGTVDDATPPSNTEGANAP